MRNTFLVLASATLMFSAGCTRHPDADRKNPPPPPPALAAPATPMAFGSAAATPSTLPASPPGASSTAPVGGGGSTPAMESPTAKKLMADTGLSFRFPAGATVKASADGGLQFTAGGELFVSMEAVDSIDQAMKTGIARMKAIDREAKEVKTTERDQGGIKQKANPRHHEGRRRRGPVGGGSPSTVARRP